MLASLIVLLAACIFLAGCGEPVRIGVHEAYGTRTYAERGYGPGLTPPRPAPEARPTAAPRSVPAPHQSEGFVLGGGGTESPPTLPKSHDPLDIVALRLERDGSGGSHPIAFGQAFAEGALPRASRLAARIDGRVIPAQLDVDASYPDGSIRFGIVTLVTATPADVTLIRQPAEAAARFIGQQGTGS